MLARVVEMQIFPEKSETFRTLATNDILPILKKNPGFVDWLTFKSETTPTKMTTVLLFKTKSDLEKYERETVPGIMQKIRQFLTQEPKVEIHSVENSTFHRITSNMAA